MLPPEQTSGWTVGRGRRSLGPGSLEGCPWRLLQGALRLLLALAQVHLAWPGVGACGLGSLSASGGPPSLSPQPQSPGVT